MKSSVIQLSRTQLWTDWFTRRIGSSCKPKSPYASATQPRPQSPAHRTEEMGHAAPQYRPLESALIDRQELLPLSRQTALRVTP
jgi:hypothetical protein